MCWSNIASMPFDWGSFGSGLRPIDPTLALSNRVVDRCPEHSEFGEDQAMIVMIAILYIEI